MNCPTCGKEAKLNEKTCSSCNQPLPKANNPYADLQNSSTPTLIKGIVLFMFISIVVTSAISIWISTPSKNFEISETTKESTDYVENSPLETLKNEAYGYANNSDYQQATATFNKALTYAEEGTLDYHLIKGEIAALEGDVANARSNYEKAYELNPYNFQINNALTLFYLDIDNNMPEALDYPKAFVHAQKAYNYSNKNQTTTENLALASFFTDNFEYTIELLSDPEFENDPELAYWIGLSYWALAEDDLARPHLQKAYDAGIELSEEMIETLELN